MRAIHALTFTVAAGLIATAMTSCSSFDDCQHKRTCVPYVPEGGGAGTGGVGGSTPQGGRSGSGGDEAGNAGSGDAAGASPCNGDCTGKTPVCDVASNSCVECLSGGDCKAPKPACDVASNACVECVSGTDCKSPTPACDTATNACVECTQKMDCKDTAKPFCDQAAEQCVACLKQADCTAPTASACNAGQCEPCTIDAQCSDITGKGVCDAGTCVQCTIAKESNCAGKSCNPATKACTATAVGSVTTCMGCVADSECAGGNQADPEMRCVPMTFKGNARPGGFCLRRSVKTCGRPYSIGTTGKSLSGAASETYCGIDQNSTRCEAVLDLVGSEPCMDGKDISCGCIRDGSGNCVGDGEGGLCKTVGVISNRCTYACGISDDCPAGRLCLGAPTSYCQ